MNVQSLEYDRDTRKCFVLYFCFVILASEGRERCATTDL